MTISRMADRIGSAERPSGRLRSSTLACGAVALVIALGPRTGTAATPAEELLKAASKGDVKKVQSLLAKERLDTTDKNTALHHAVAESRTAVVGVLLAGGADPNGAASKFDGPPLISALRGLNIVIESNVEATLPLARGLRAQIDSVVYQTVDALIKGGADINARNGLGMTALGVASEKGLLQTVELLLAKGADPNARNSKGTTVLMAACFDKYNLPKLVEVLIKAGADPTATNEAGQTALEIATGAHANTLAEVLRNAIAK